jgi:hypothetical protein
MEAEYQRLSGLDLGGLELVGRAVPDLDRSFRFAPERMRSADQ